MRRRSSLDADVRGRQAWLRRPSTPKTSADKHRQNFSESSRATNVEPTSVGHRADVGTAAHRLFRSGSKSRCRTRGTCAPRSRDRPAEWVAFVCVVPLKAIECRFLIYMHRLWTVGAAGTIMVFPLGIVFALAVAVGAISSHATLHWILGMQIIGPPKRRKSAPILRRALHSSKRNLLQRLHLTSPSPLRRCKPHWTGTDCRGRCVRRQTIARALKSCIPAPAGICFACERNCRSPKTMKS